MFKQLLCWKCKTESLLLLVHESCYCSDNCRCMEQIRKDQEAVQILIFVVPKSVLTAWYSSCLRIRYSYCSCANFRQLWNVKSCLQNSGGDNPKFRSSLAVIRKFVSCPKVFQSIFKVWLWMFRLRSQANQSWTDDFSELLLSELQIGIIRV